MCSSSNTTLTLKHLKLINTICEESLQYFEDDEALKEMLRVYDNSFTPPKKWGVTCVMVSTKQVDEEKELNDVDNDKEEHNSKILR